MSDQKRCSTRRAPSNRQWLPSLPRAPQPKRGIASKELVDQSEVVVDQPRRVQPAGACSHCDRRGLQESRAAGHPRQPRSGAIHSLSTAAVPNRPVPQLKGTGGCSPCCVWVMPRRRVQRCRGIWLRYAASCRSANECARAALFAYSGRSVYIEHRFRIDRLHELGIQHSVTRAHTAGCAPRHTQRRPHRARRNR